MDMNLAVRAAQAAERLPSRCCDRDALLRHGSTRAWLNACVSGSLPVATEPVDVPGRLGCVALGWADAQYPSGLRHLRHPPPALFVRGAPLPLPDVELSVAIIGARRCTELGRGVARDLARGLARAGVVVVSGLALGIDAAAHEGALDGGGQTLAVLASPVSQPSPRRNLSLAEEILESGGWLLSERPPGAQLRAHDFPRRNRLVAGLTRLVVVVEAGLRSGTLSTVGHALDLGLEVAAVPGPVTSPASAGAHELLRRGAQIVTSVRDVLELLRRSASSPPELCPLSPDARTLKEALPGAQGSTAQWLDASGLPRDRAISALHSLLSRGELRRLPGGRIARCL